MLKVNPNDFELINSLAMEFKTSRLFPSTFTEHKGTVWQHVATLLISKGGPENILLSALVAVLHHDPTNVFRVTNETVKFLIEKTKPFGEIEYSQELFMNFLVHLRSLDEVFKVSNPYEGEFTIVSKTLLKSIGYCPHH